MNLLWSRGITKELRQIRLQLTRLADCWEHELAVKGVYMRPPQADTSGEPPDLIYTDESQDALKELEELVGKKPKSIEEDQ